MTFAHDLWERFGGLRLDDVPDDVVTVAEHCILDWFGCAVAGSRTDLADILRDVVAATPGSASIVASHRTCAAGEAALVNGAAGHALDFDDTHMEMGGHPTAPVWPAAFAVAEELDAGGLELLTAFIVGFEVETQLGRALGTEPYERGWHTTSTAGVFGATAAVSYLLGLNSAQFGHAAGIAASQASGLKANFGTMTKPLHAGQAAERGILAARLAERGFTANPSAFEGNQGLLQATGAADRASAPTGDPTRWSLHRTLFKYHASCYLTHAPIEAALAAADRISPTEIDALVVEVHPALLDVCGIPSPTTGLQAKFSLRGTVTLALLGDNTADPETFDDKRIVAEDVQSLLERVEVVTDSSLDRTASRVRITTVDGSELDASFDAGVPATDLGLQGSRLRQKFDALAMPVLGDGADLLAERVDSLERLDSARALAVWSPS
jgi:2-methylcitrate dehydratase PrpD